MVDNKVEKIHVKSDVYSLMMQAAKEMRCFGVSMGFGAAMSYLGQLTTRAMQLDDPVLLAILEKLCTVELDKKILKLIDAEYDAWLEKNREADGEEG